MAEVLVEFETTVSGRDGTRWRPNVCGRVGHDGLWEGWIEFASTDESAAPIRTPRETQQPNRDDLMYWAEGLSQAYLESALLRALDPAPRPAMRAQFDGPARRAATRRSTAPRAVLDPLEVYLQGEDVLLRQLSALDVSRLRDIVIAYGWESHNAASALDREALTAAIMTGVRR